MKASILSRELLKPMRNIKETNLLDVVPPLGLHAGVAKRLCPPLEFTAVELPLDAHMTSFLKTEYIS